MKDSEFFQIIFHFSRVFDQSNSQDTYSLCSTRHGTCKFVAFKKERFPLTRFLNIMSEETTTNDSTSHLLCAVVLQFFSDKCIVLIKCFISLCPTVPHIRISRVGEKHTPCLAKITIYLV